MRPNSKFRLPLLLKLAVFSFHHAYADKITATGVDQSEVAALQFARQVLATNIFVHVESNVELSYSTENGESTNIATQTSTDIPLFAVDSSCKRIDRQKRPFYECTVTMDKAKSLPLYKTELSKIAEEINGIATINRENTPYSYWKTALSRHDTYSKYLTVFQYLGGNLEQLKRPEFSRSTIENALLSAQSKAKTLEDAAAILTADIKQHEAIYVYPPTPTNSKEFTQFSLAVKANIDTQLAATTSDIKQAKYVYQGTYDKQRDSSGILLSYNLVNTTDSSILDSSVSLVAPTAYKTLDTEPKLVDFDSLLRQGYLVENSHTIGIHTNQGSRNLLFSGGEELELFIVSNRPCYFYVIGHTKASDTEISYLMPLNDGPEARLDTYIQYIPVHNTNKYVSLGEYEVYPPYGTESLQVIAFPHEDGLRTRMPKFRYNDESGYAEVSKSITEGLKVSRGLKRKKPKAAESAIPAEAILQYTTQPAD